MSIYRNQKLAIADVKPGTRAHHVRGEAVGYIKVHNADENGVYGTYTDNRTFKTVIIRNPDFVVGIYC